jgi:hypothetical protein
MQATLPGPGDHARATGTSPAHASIDCGQRGANAQPAPTVPGSGGLPGIVRSDAPPTSVFNQAVIAAGRAYKCEKNAEPYVGEVEFSFKTTASDDE